MTITEKKYDWYNVLSKTAYKYSHENLNLIEIFIEIKGMQSEWFWLRYRNDKPEMWRGPRRGPALREQQGPELEKERDNLGEVDIKKGGEFLGNFQDYDSFWKDMNK
jgi:hypothetical protein